MILKFIPRFWSATVSLLIVAQCFCFPSKKVTFRHGSHLIKSTQVLSAMCLHFSHTPRKMADTLLHLQPLGAETANKCSLCDDLFDTPVSVSHCLHLLTKNKATSSERMTFSFNQIWLFQKPKLSAHVKRRHGNSPTVEKTVSVHVHVPFLLFSTSSNTPITVRTKLAC